MFLGTQSPTQQLLSHRVIVKVKDMMLKQGPRAHKLIKLEAMSEALNGNLIIIS